MTLRLLSDMMALALAHRVQVKFANDALVIIVPGAKDKNLELLRGFFPSAVFVVFNPEGICVSDNNALWTCTDNLIFFDRPLTAALCSMVFENIDYPFVPVVWMQDVHYYPEVAPAILDLLRLGAYVFSCGFHYYTNALRHTSNLILRNGPGAELTVTYAGNG